MYVLHINIIEFIQGENKDVSIKTHEKVCMHVFFYYKPMFKHMNSL